MSTIVRPTVFKRARTIVSGVTTRQFGPTEERREALHGRLAAETGMAVASVGQVHASDVVVVAEAGHTEAHDGLVTDRPDLLLAVVAADCGIILLADEERGVVGACHSGWRGTVAGVVERTVESMAGLGARTETLRAYIGPCISVDSFEVGEEVAEHFDARAVIRRDDWAKPHVDLKSDLRRRLVDLGLDDSMIETDSACTIADNDRFYSYRAEGRSVGRIVGFIGKRGA